jgi:hypothetical protein
MNYKNATGRLRSLAGICLLAGALSSPAMAANFIYVAYGSGVSVYSNAVTTGTGTVLAAPSGGWGNAFSIAVDSTGFIYVGDAGNNRIVVYDGRNTNATPTLVGTLLLPTDSTGGNISPQEIALDSSGNLYVTSYNGTITKFASATAEAGGGTLSGSTIETVPGARGILINGTTAYVSTSANGGATLQSFSTSTTNSSQTTLFTTGAYPSGQLRGLAIDNLGGLYLADTSWTSSNGYIEFSSDNGATWSVLGNGTSGFLQNLTTGPNDMVVANQSAIGGHGTFQTLYVANYFAGTIQVIQSGQDNAPGQQGKVVGNLITLGGGLHATGLGFAQGNGALAGATPLFVSDLFDQTTALPEPSTFAMIGGALVVGGILRRRKNAA